jgi:CRISPR/Cas system CMR subunit Cmr4 (Cas7 group RAMP superfamily)
MEELTIKAAAEYYGKSESWIRKKILNGQLEAEKRPFQYGQRWITTEKALDQLAEDLKEQAKIEKDSINIREVSRPVDKEKFLNELIEATEGRNKQLIDEAVNNITDKIEAQNNQLQQQNEIIKKLSDQVEEMQQRQNKSLFDKVKDFFK